MVITANMKLKTMKTILNKGQMFVGIKLLFKIGLFALLAYLVIGNPMAAKAQNYDYGSVEAYINDHKQQRSLLMARATLEYGNQLLHEESSKSANDYKEVNIDLDKYTRAFDVIDLIYQSLRTAVNIYHTYDDVSETIKDYKDLLEMFNQRVIERGKIELADTMLISINYRAIGQLANETEYLYKSVCDLVVYCTGVASCTTAELLVMIDDINTSIDRIRTTIRRAYISTWKYVQLRIGFWKEKVYRTHTKRELLEGAFERWRLIGIKVIEEK